LLDGVTLVDQVHLPLSGDTHFLKGFRTLKQPQLLVRMNINISINSLSRSWEAFDLSCRALESPLQVCGRSKLYETNSYLRLLLEVLTDDSTEVSKHVSYEYTHPPFALLRGRNLSDEVSNLLEVLDDRERKIIFQRFALNGGKSKTLEEVAHKFGFTRKRVRQLQNIALAKLRSRIQSDPTLRRILVVFVTGLVLGIRGQPFLGEPIKSTALENLNTGKANSRPIG
jgi:hypothetical protein